MNQSITIFHVNIRSTNKDRVMVMILCVYASMNNKSYPSLFCSVIHSFVNILYSPGSVRHIVVKKVHEQTKTT